VSRPHYVRRAHELNQEIVVSHCAVCHRFIGAAPSYRLLKLMEDIHQCGTHTPAVRAKKKKKRHAPRKFQNSLR
jgi:hypothetical protein